MINRNKNQITINKKLLQLQKELNAVRDAIFWARKCRNVAEIARLTRSETRLLWMIDSVKSYSARRTDIRAQT